MSTHQRFVRAVMDAIPNPSPALTTYIENYRNIILTRGDDEIKIFEDSIALFNRLTAAERQQLINIQKGL